MFSQSVFKKIYNVRVVSDCTCIFFLFVCSLHKTTTTLNNSPNLRSSKVTIIETNFKVNLISFFNVYVLYSALNHFQFCPYNNPRGYFLLFVRLNFNIEFHQNYQTTSVNEKWFRVTNFPGKSFITIKMSERSLNVCECSGINLLKTKFITNYSGWHVLDLEIRLFLFTGKTFVCSTLERLRFSLIIVRCRTRTA